MAATTVKPEVRRDKVAVLASTIVRELASVRLRDLERERVVTEDPPVEMTPKLRRLLRRYNDLARKRRVVRSQLARVGPFYFDNDYNDSGKAGIARVRESRQVKEDKAKRALAARMSKVRELRTATLIDLVTLDPNEAKAVVAKFRKAIEQI